MRRRDVTLAGIVALALLAGCSADSAPPSAADSAFTRDMAISGSTAMDLALQAQARSRDERVLALADEVFVASSPVVDQLAELGPALAADGADGFAHDDSDDHEEQSANRSTELRDSSANKFDATFRELIRAEVDEGLQIAVEAQGSVTDARTKAMADEVVRAWTLLADRASEGA